jgi:antirestriction protein ArdC
MLDDLHHGKILTEYSALLEIKQLFISGLLCGMAEAVEHRRNTDGRIVRPLRANGIRYRGINVLTPLGEALDKGYASPIWPTIGA